MDTQPKIYYEDLAIAKAILNRDAKITMQFLYGTCYPMFKALYNGYFTDCDNCKEFIDEIYVLIMTVGKRSGHCPLQKYRGESSLFTWLKNASLTYCYNKFKKRINTVSSTRTENSNKETNIDMVEIAGFIEMDMSELERRDEAVIQNIIFQKMKNKRYSMLLKLHMIEHKEHNEIAQIMGMTMPNYYNKRKLAKDQYNQVKKELNL